MTDINVILQCSFCCCYESALIAQTLHFEMNSFAMLSYVVIEFGCVWAKNTFVFNRLLVFWLLVSSDVWGLTAFITAFGTREKYPFMLRLYMHFQIFFLCRAIITNCAKMTFAFMFDLYMLFQIPSYSWFMIALIARINNTFMIHLYM